MKPGRVRGSRTRSTGILLTRNPFVDPKFNSGTLYEPADFSPFHKIDGRFRFSFDSFFILTTKINFRNTKITERALLPVRAATKIGTILVSRDVFVQFRK